MLPSMMLAQRPLRSSVRIVSPEAISSGTVFKVLHEDGAHVAYVLSTGHLSRPDSLKAEFFFIGGQRLSQPAKLPAEVVALVNNKLQGIDFSILRVPIPSYWKIDSCPLGKQVHFDKTLASIGCQNGDVPQVFEVFTINWSNENRGRNEVKAIDGGNAKPGRSGGGLFHNGRVVAVLWGSGPKECYYTSCHVVIKYMRRNGLEHLT